jgi:hypothetical protein
MKPKMKTELNINALVMALGVLLFVSTHTSIAQHQANKQKSTASGPNSHTAMGSMNMQTLQALDTSTIERVMGMKGKSNKGEYKVTVPQNDLKIEVDGFLISPPMGLGTWIAFTPAHDGAYDHGRPCNNRK